MLINYYSGRFYYLVGLTRMAEPDSQEKEFVHYTPQHPLPEEIRTMTRDDTVCQYCGLVI